MIKNKKADIAITILVIGVIVLCTVALLSFYLIRDKQVKGVVNSARSLQNFYNMADSIKYSGLGQIDKYEELDNYEINDNLDKIIIKKKYYIHDLGISGDNKEVLDITYNFKP